MCILHVIVYWSYDFSSHPFFLFTFYAFMYVCLLSLQWIQTNCLWKREIDVSSWNFVWTTQGTSTPVAEFLPWKRGTGLKWERTKCRFYFLAVPPCWLSLIQPESLRSFSLAQNSTHCICDSHSVFVTTHVMRHERRLRMCARMFGMQTYQSQSVCLVPVWVSLRCRWNVSCGWMTPWTILCFFCMMGTPCLLPNISSDCVQHPEALHRIEHTANR